MSGPWVVAFLALWALMMVLAVGMLGLIRIVTSSNPHLAGQAAGSPSGLSSGDRLADFEAAGLDGSPVTRRTLLGERWTVLITQAGCPPCLRILDEIADAPAGPGGTRILLVTDDALSVARIPRRSGVTIAVDRNGSVARAFDVYGSPLCFLVDDGEIVRVIVPAGLRDVLALGGEQQLGCTSRSTV